MTSAITVRDLGKRYLLGKEAVGGNLRESLTRGAKGLARSGLDLVRGKREREKRPTLWALRNLDLDVREGEVLGVIGHNGAGKSTLLKILSRITTPTEGEIILRGRVGALLEVGTGFHRELTGRENVYLNAAILGMPRAELEAKFDEIVAFSGVERFIDTPIKHYSSGMALRLGFAVAAHIEPEILLVDEVLAVGDLAFQRKCLGKMQDVTRSDGRTILFVSHNLYAIQSICDRVAWLDHGSLRMLGDPEEVIAKYRLAMSEEGEAGKERYDFDTDDACIDAIFVNGIETRYATLSEAGPLRVEWLFTLHTDQDVALGAALLGPGGVGISGLASLLEGQTFALEAGSYRTGFEIPRVHLNSGVYTINLSVLSAEGSHFFARRHPAVTISSESAPTFDALLHLDHQWFEPRPVESSQ